MTSDRTMFEAFARRSAELHRQRAHDLRERGHALPGAAAALAALADMDGIVQSVVTGNIRPVAEVKLQVFGLDTHIRFPYGGYGEDHDDRAELVRTAIARTRAASGTDVALNDVLLIGDTPRRSRRTRGRRSRTGRRDRPYLGRELADAGATATVPDLRDQSPLRDLLR
ncbi:haloacid dehalogenase-like hydrolase [Streptomyces sp. ARC12]|uniref:haloacid dehalogenase-like hydrolase n=1 Tax=Streptomyces sp. ARC12 TaxID=2724151 RepID=UPI0038572AA2